MVTLCFSIPGIPVCIQSSWIHSFFSQRQLLRNLDSLVSPGHPCDSVSAWMSQLEWQVHTTARTVVTGLADVSRPAIWKAPLAALVRTGTIVVIQASSGLAVPRGPRRGQFMSGFERRECWGLCGNVCCHLWMGGDGKARTGNSNEEVVDF